MKKIKIGLAGLGTVGKSILEILEKDKEILQLRNACEFEVVAASARSKKDFLPNSVKFYDNAVDLASINEIDVIIEVIGGDTVAKDLIYTALKNGKKVITANKALIANYGYEIAKLCHENNSYIGFEASTVGANPVIQSFKENFTVANQVTEFFGILNGTCNFILTKMKNEGLDFDVVLKEAQELGYAEADPTFDINGTDSAHKLAILGAIASGSKPDFAAVHVEGIDKISIDDVSLADELGYQIKLLGIYKDLGEEFVRAVYPALVAKSSMIAQVESTFNAVLTNNSNAGFNMMIGHGAGGLVTASAIIADLADIAHDKTLDLFGVDYHDLKDIKTTKIDQRNGQYFLRLILNKELAQKDNLADQLFAGKIKIEQIVLKDDNDQIICGIITNELKESDLLQIIESFDSNLVKLAKFTRVENINN